MRRKPTTRLQIAAALLAVLLAAVANLSCGKSVTPLQPGRMAAGSRGASNADLLGKEMIIPTEAILTLADGVTLNDYLIEKDLALVSTLSIPAAGSFQAETYYLVHSKDEKEIDLEGFAFDARVKSASPHDLIWMPEDDRGGLPFDDQDSWRTGGDYLAQPAIATVMIPRARLVTEGEGQTIAILDTGIDTQHPLFLSYKAHFKLAWNYTVFPPAPGVTDTGDGQDGDGDGKVDDGVGHGTHVTGIAFTGARKATFMIYKVLNDEGRGTSFGLAKALLAASDYGVNVINLSLGLMADNRMIHHVIAQCTAKGIAVVASAGNRANDDLQYPAAYDEVTSVTAVDPSDMKADFASYGSTVDIAAPGVDIISPIPSFFGVGKYATASGGSMAAPFVSAAIALEHARWPWMTPVEAANHVVALGDDISLVNPSYPSLIGYSRVNLQRPLVVAE